jgi:hypothetical protein
MASHDYKATCKIRCDSWKHHNILPCESLFESLIIAKAILWIFHFSQGLKFDFFLSIHMDTKVLKFGIPPDDPVSQIWILN